MLIQAETATSHGTRRTGSKKSESRERILEAALEVFARHPYQNASFRMISKLAEVEHPLISYYFGSKADLFKTVLNRVMEQRLELQDTWIAETKPMSATRGFSLFLDNLLEDYRKRPGLFHIVSLNFQQADHSHTIPGYELIEAFMKKDSARIKEKLDLEVPEYEAEMFVRAMSALLVNFLGGSGSYAKMLGAEADSFVYFNWVKETVLYTLLPRFKQMVQKPSSSENRELK